MRGRRSAVTTLVIIVIITTGFYLAAAWLRQRDFRDEFAKMRLELGRLEVMEETRSGGHLYRSIKSGSGRGIPFSARVKIPIGGEKPYPALVILGGLRTGRMTVDYIEGTTGIIILALDYPYEGRKENLTTYEFLLSLSRIHKAVLETVPAVMLGVDYLLSRDDVDPERIILVGGSLGALFVPAVMASDSRITAGAIIFGAGDIQHLIEANLDMTPPLPAAAGWISSVLVSPVEPLKYVDYISPRPLFILNGRYDPRIPFECVRKLQEKAQEPKTVRWIDSEHLNVKSEEFHKLVSEELIEWLVSQELIEPGSFRRK